MELMELKVMQMMVVASLGERTIIFSLGPFHVEKHRDGYNHFYEFYEFPARNLTNTVQNNANQNLYNNKNRRMNEAFALFKTINLLWKKWLS